MTQDHEQHVDQTKQHANRSATCPRVVRSEEILQGHREIHILHANETYRLRVTRNGKLILYK